ncbi:hypothetical protein CEE56_19225 [Stenotrophomonas maltophilia]|nr:PDZ domain-containing protein [Stenotrophomonas maltophilia]OWQ66334.1 hypothetical protein CEE56_19225 [Stenotrophomonas maltophilia]
MPGLALHAAAPSQPVRAPTSTLAPVNWAGERALGPNKGEGMKHFVWSGALALALIAEQAHADPAKLGSTPAPVVTVKGRSVQDVQNAIVAMMLPAGKTPVRQDQNVMIYEFPLSFWQSIGVQMAQGNSGWQEPKGRLTFTMAQMGSDVMVSNKFETVATNMFNASNSVEITNPVVYNENHLGLQLVAAFAEGRMVPGEHNALGIQAYEKPTRKTRKVGAVIETLVPGAPAEQAGLRPGDVITHIGGVPLAEQSPATIQLLGYLQIGEANLQVLNKGEVVVHKRLAPNAPAVARATPNPAPAEAAVPAASVVPDPVSPAPAASTQESRQGWWQKQKGD